jgi:hypothetical protein
LLRTENEHRGKWDQTTVLRGAEVRPVENEKVFIRGCPTKRLLRENRNSGKLALLGKPIPKEVLPPFVP